MQSNHLISAHLVGELLYSEAQKGDSKGHHWEVDLGNILVFSSYDAQVMILWGNVRETISHAMGSSGTLSSEQKEQVG